MGGGLANGSKPFVLGISPFLRYLRSTGDTDKWKGRILSFPILMPEVHGASAWALNGTILHYDLSRQGYSDGDGNLMTGDEAACLVTLCLRY